MAKTRSKPATSSTAPPKAKSSLPSLPPPVESPPQLVVLPRDASPDARIITIDNTRYLIDPTRGLFYEFTRISAPKSTPRSWLLAPSSPGEESQQGRDDGYILSNPSLLVATPIDPLFLLIPCLTSDITSQSTEYLAPSDYLDKLSPSSPHLPSLLRNTTVEKILESRIEAVSDCMEMGDDGKLYAFSLPKLVAEIVQKARRMSAKSLPQSMEERFVKAVLDVPVLSVRREESTQDSTTGAETDPESLKSTTSGGTTITSADTTATSPSSTDPEETTVKNNPITPLLRLRTSLDFLLKSYIPSSLLPLIEPLIAQSIDWTPLTTHLEKLATLKKEAQALRSIGENFSRKRALGDEDEGREERLKRKREDEARAKRSVSQGVRKLAKVDRSGMKSLQSFFGRK